MSLKAKILLLAILPMVLVTTAITYVSYRQAQLLAEKDIATFEENLLAAKKSALRDYTELALTSIEHILRNPNLDDAWAQAEVKSILNGMTYGEDGYFFVYDRNGVNLVHPIQSELVGREMIAYQDPAGDYVIRNLLKAAFEGGGFHRYVWNKPSAGQELEKLAHVVELKRWQWMMGTGLYIDDVAAEVARIREEVNRNVRQTFLSVAAIVSTAVVVIVFIGVAINLHESRLADSRLQELAHRSIQFQINERRRFARELHDGINQIMVSVKFRIELAAQKFRKQDPSGLADLDKGGDALNQAIHEVRRISHDLRPSLLDDMGLATAVRSLLTEFETRTGMDLDFDCELGEDGWPEDIEITLYRVVQEGLTNIERHADASRVRVHLWQSRGIARLGLVDNGRGFQLAGGGRSEGIGIRNMRERVELLGGQFIIQSEPGKGTRIRARLPLVLRTHQPVMTT